MFLVGVAFLVGHCVLHSLPRLPAPHLAIALGLAVVAAVCLSFQRRTRTTAVISIALIFGFGSAWWRADLGMAERWPESRSGEDVELEGFIASIVDERTDSKRFQVDVEDRTHTLPKHVELTWYDSDARPRAGEFWRLEVRLRAPRGFANPGGYDVEAQMLREGIGATGYVRESSTNVRLATPRWSYPVLRCRAWIADRLTTALPSSRALGIVEGLAIGETSKMDREQWRVFANTGTTHLMAISGMHIGMVALLIANLARRAARRLSLHSTRVSISYVGAAAGMGAAIAYSSLAGLSVPTQRTLIMLCVYFGAKLLRREVVPAHGLAVALVAVLLIDPFAPLAPGFWLSFGAVAALFLAGDGRIAVDSKWREYFRAQTVVTIGLAPLLIGAFGNLSLISPFVNLLAIPFFTLLVVPAVLIATSVLMVSAHVGAILLHLVSLLLDFVWPAMVWASELPLAMFPFPRVPAWAFAMLITGAFVMLAPGLIATRIAGAMLCLPALLWQSSKPQVGEFEMTVLDVGQGLAVVVRTATHVLVYDTGPSFRGGRDTGELAVIPFLHSLGLRSADAVVVSHGDSDHAGGLRSVVSGVAVGRIVLGPSVSPIDRSEICMSGQSWNWDRVAFEILHPQAEGSRIVDGGGKRRNDSSCVIRVSNEHGSALLLGDIEARAERELVGSGVIAHTDVVTVPHHGSRTSSTREFIAATSPRYALISAGFGNRFGFPRPDVVARWKDSGAAVFETASSGAITLTVSSSGVMPPRAYRQDERRYWRQ